MALTREVLATTTAAAVTLDASAKGFELQNLGPNSVWVAFDAASCVLNKCRKIAAGDYWSCPQGTTAFYLLAETASQVTGAATILSEFR